jgi:hypothetical protein
VAETERVVAFPRSIGEGVTSNAVIDSGAGFTIRFAVATIMLRFKSETPVSIVKVPTAVGVHVSVQVFDKDARGPGFAHPLVAPRSA